MSALGFVRGDRVSVAVYRAGPPTRRPVGYLTGVVVNAHGEYDVALVVDDAQPVEEIEEILAAAGGDVRVEDLRRPLGDLLLRNCQPEELSLDPVGLLSRDVFVALRDRWRQETPLGARDSQRLLASVEARLGVAA